MVNMLASSEVGHGFITLQPILHRTLMARTPQTLMISFVQELISISRLFHVKDSYIPFHVLEIYIFFPLQPTFWTIKNGSNPIDLLSSSSFDACICVSKC
jgi:hypothetical protein